MSYALFKAVNEGQALTKQQLLELKQEYNVLVNSFSAQFSQFANLLNYRQKGKYVSLKLA